MTINTFKPILTVAMMIKSLRVSKLFYEYDYDIDVYTPLTFLHSPNGMGKSTLMHMLYAALKGDVKFLSEIPFERMEIWFKDEAVMIIQNYGGRLHTLMQKNEVDTPLDPDAMSKVCSAVYIPPERLSVKRKDGHIASSLEVYAHKLHERFRYAKEHSELDPYPELARRNLTDEELEFWAKVLKAKLDFIKNAGFEPNMPSRMKFPPSRSEINKDREGYENLTASIAEYIDKNYVLAESVIIFKDIVNEIFMDKSITVSDTGKIGITMNNGMSLPLQRLSSGEKQILIMFFLLLFYTEPGSVVVLDEPEISLHVCWQQKLGRFFLDICRIRGIQMIVATHSPQVIHDLWDSAKELRPANARAHHIRRHLQPNLHGEVGVRRHIPPDGGRHGRAAF